MTIIVRKEATNIELSGVERRVIIKAVVPGETSDTPEEIRDKLETLTNDNRLDASAIKNLPEFQWNSTTW